MSELSQTTENMLTLADIRRELENKYGPYRFAGDNDEVFELTSAMRLSKEQRKVLQDRLNTLETKEGEPEKSEDEVVATMEEVFIMLCKDGKGYTLVRQLGGDLALLMDLLERWQAKTQLGEASRSQS